MKHRTNMHVQRMCLMYHAACKVEFQPFNQSYSQLMCFQLFIKCPFKLRNAAETWNTKLVEPCKVKTYHSDVDYSRRFCWWFLRLILSVVHVLRLKRSETAADSRRLLQWTGHLHESVPHRTRQRDGARFGIRQRFSLLLLLSYILLLL